MKPIDPERVFKRASATLGVDPTEAARALNLLHRPGDLIELRALETRRGTMTGYFDDPAKLVAALKQCDNAGATGIYLTLNPIGNGALLARAANRVKPYAKHTTADADIESRRWFAIDFDPVRPAGISSNEPEHRAAIERARAASKQLTAMFGWPAPILADSGNGGHLLYPIDLPNDDAARDLMQRALAALAAMYDEKKVVEVDRSVFNAARVWKLYGTTARKGDALPDRPHRPARIISAPKTLKAVTRAQLEAVAALAPGPSADTGTAAPGANFIDSFLARHPEIRIKRMNAYRGGRRIILQRCVFDPTHTRTSVAIIEMPNGAVAYKCQHNSCADKKWTDVREKFESRTSAASNNGARPIKLKIKTISEGMAEIEARGQRTALWGDVVVAGELSLLAGRPRAGKSTLALALSKHIAEGAPFLCLPTRKSRVLYLALERNSRQVIMTLSKWKVGDEDVKVLDELPPQATVADLCDALEVEIARNRFDVVIIDGLQGFAKIVKGNDYGVVSVTLEPLNRLTRRTNVAIIALGHQGKTDREDGTGVDVIGSIAYQAATDVMIECKKTKDQRYTVLAEVRIGVGFQKIQVHVDLHTGEARFEDAWRAEYKAVADKVIAYLSGQKEPVMQRDILDAVKARREMVLKVLNDEIGISRAGSGKSNDPYLYSYQKSETISEAERTKVIAEVAAHRPKPPARKKKSK